VSPYRSDNRKVDGVLRGERERERERERGRGREMNGVCLEPKKVKTTTSN